MSIDSLREVGLLADVGEERVADLEASGEERRFAVGEFLFHEGDPATCFMFLLDGELETTKSMGGDDVVLQRHVPGGYLGAIALLTDTPFRASTRAVKPSRVFCLEPDAFHRLVLEEPTVRRVIYRVFDPVMQGLQGAAAQREKLVALGGLAAGLAHELNNPASAARRAVTELGRALQAHDSALDEMVLAGLSREQMHAMLDVRQRLDHEAGRDLDPLEASDREDAIAARLASHGVEDAAWTAAMLVPAGVDDALVEDLVAQVGEAALPAAVRWLGALAQAPLLIETALEATSRISKLIDAVKQYTFMDQAPRGDVDVNEGLGSTLTILGHKLREGSITVEQDLDPGLPKIQAYGSELNQLWTNLLDNAIDAVGGSGTIRLTSTLDIDRVVVEIADDGPGIPEEALGRIFEPFFTTKPVGKGTGLGLDIAQRIVIKHRGELTVESRPGDTRFTVRLPQRLEG
ncbi:MAG: ATP-binding protein [Gaiellales bacterium]